MRPRPRPRPSFRRSSPVKSGDFDRTKRANNIASICASGEHYFSCLALLSDLVNWYVCIYLFDDFETFIKIILYNNIEVKLNVRR